MRESACSYGLCDGSGFVDDPDTNSSRACRCKVEQARAKSLTRALSAVPPRYHDVELDRNPLAELPNEIRSPLRSYGQELEEKLQVGCGLWISGPNRTGKTCAAAWIIKQCPAGRSAALWPAERLLARIKDTFRENSPISSWELREQLVDLDLLVLDDLGAVNATDWVRDAFFGIINDRYNEQKAIVVTTDLPVTELCTALNKRTVNRLLEICGRPLEIPGSDLPIETSVEPAPVPLRAVK